MAVHNHLCLKTVVFDLELQCIYNTGPWLLEWTSILETVFLPITPPENFYKKSEQKELSNVVTTIYLLPNDTIMCWAKFVIYLCITLSRIFGLICHETNICDIYNTMSKNPFQEKKNKQNVHINILKVFVGNARCW